jgi:hypothetical protein
LACLQCNNINFFAYLQRNNINVFAYRILR